MDVNVFVVKVGSTMPSIWSEMHERLQDLFNRAGQRPGGRGHNVTVEVVERSVCRARSVTNTDLMVYAVSNATRSVLLQTDNPYSRTSGGGITVPNLSSRPTPQGSPLKV